ncbi:perilipin-3-like [Latimeria chalumnae]|uniref:perilipin-3-like n=1 Tax=Latimeria chalumnae TaxID=7897 RepID=UPI00313C7F63
MASNGDKSNPVPERSAQETNGDQQNVVSRVANLPLVSSACDMVAAAYENTRENYPYVKSVCDVAEKGVKTLTTVAVSGAQPIINKLEPQIAAANELACKGLDQMEEKLPVLNQPIDQAFADTKDLVSSTVTSAKGAVSGAKEAVTSTVTGVVDVAKGAVQGGMEMTKAAVSDSVNTVMGSTVGQLVATGVDTALNKSEEWVDHYLPMTEEELANVATSVEGFEVTPAQQPSYYVRLGSLSTKLRHRAYKHSLGKMGQARQSTQDALSQLQNTIDLIEHAKKSVDSANQKLYQTWLDWRNAQPEQKLEEDLLQKPEQIESRTLAMMQSLIQQLQTTCLTLVSSVQGLPQNIQDQIGQVRQAAEELHLSFSSVSSFQELSGQILSQSKERVLNMRESVDGVMEYLLNNTPLNWLVGPFAPQLTERPEEEKIDTKQ